MPQERNQAKRVWTGGCLCGAVRYEVRGPLRPVTNCHCGQCRRFHGHVGAYTAAKRADFTLAEESGLKWFESSKEARRGFCETCGSSLFFRSVDDDGKISIAAGTLDDARGLETVAHIFVAHKGDYYEITDDLDRFPEYD